MLRGGEEHRVEFERATRLEFNGRELPFVVRDARQPIGNDVDAVAGEAGAVLFGDARTVGQQHDMRAPGPERQCKQHAAFAFAQRCETLVAPLPAITVRAMEHRSAVTLAKTCDCGEVVNDAGRDQQVLRVVDFAVPELHLEEIARAIGG